MLFGREPDVALPDVDAQLRTTALALPRAAPHVSRLVGELAVGEEVARLRWHGSTGAQLSSLFDAPGGARRVALAPGLAALLDEGENHLLLLRGREEAAGFADLVLVLDVEEVREGADGGPVARAPAQGPGADPATRAPPRERWPRGWYVPLAEPGRSGADDDPRPPSNRESYERVRAWRGHAWNLERAQRVDDAIRAIAR